MAPVSAKVNREVRLSLKEYTILFCILTSALGRPVDEEIRTRAQRSEGSRRWGAQASQRVSLQGGRQKNKVNREAKNNLRP